MSVLGTFLFILGQFCTILRKSSWKIVKKISFVQINSINVFVGRLRRALRSRRIGPLGPRTGPLPTPEGRAAKASYNIFIVKWCKEQMILDQYGFVLNKKISIFYVMCVITFVSYGIYGILRIFLLTSSA